MRHFFDHSGGELDYRVLIAYPFLAVTLALLFYSLLSRSYVLAVLAALATYGSLRFLRQLVVQVDGFAPIRKRMRSAADMNDLFPYLSKLPEGFVVDRPEVDSDIEHRTNAYFYRVYISDSQRSAWIVMGANIVTAVVTLLVSLLHPNPVDSIVLTLYQISLLLAVISLASIYLAIHFDAARHRAQFDIRTLKMLVRNWYPITDVSVWLLFASLVVLAVGLAIRLVFLAPGVIPIFVELAARLEEVAK